MLAGGLHLEVAVEENGSCAAGGIEGLAAKEREAAVAIDGFALQGVVGALEIAVVEERAAAAVERTGVQTGDETAVAGLQIVTVGKGQLGLADGFHTAGAVFRGIQAVFQVHVTIVSEREILQQQTVAVEEKHREIAHGPLRLAAVAGQNDLIRLLAKSHQTKPWTANVHPDGCAVAVLSLAYFRIVGVVNPIDTRTDEHRHAVVGRSTRLQMLHGLLKGVEYERAAGCFFVGQ